MTRKSDVFKPSYTSVYVRDPSFQRKDLVLGFEEAAQKSVSENQVWLVSKNLTNLLGDTSFAKGGRYGPNGIDSQPELEKLGFKVIREADDSLFYEVEPPRGWTKLTNGYSTIIMDERGRVRADQFFKGAMYEHRANLDIQPASITLADSVKVTDEIFLRRYNALQTALQSVLGVPTIDLLGRIASEATTQRYAGMVDAIKTAFYKGKIRRSYYPLEKFEPRPVVDGLYRSPGSLKIVFDFLEKVKKEELGAPLELGIPLIVPGLKEALNSCTPPRLDIVEPVIVPVEEENEYNQLRKILQEALKDKSVPRDEGWYDALRDIVDSQDRHLHYAMHRMSPSMYSALDQIALNTLKINPIVEYHEQRELLEKVIDQEIGEIGLPFEHNGFYNQYQLPSGVILATSAHQPVTVQITDNVGKIVDSRLDDPSQQVKFQVTADGKRPLEDQLADFDKAVDLARNNLGFHQSIFGT